MVVTLCAQCQTLKCNIKCLVNVKEIDLLELTFEKCVAKYNEIQQNKTNWAR